MADNGGFPEDDSLKGEEENENSATGRAEWGSKKEYVLSLLGYAVGLGSLWRFPYLCNRNGGGAFLIPYFVGIITCGVPLFFLEVTIGQFSNMSATHVWVICPLFKGIGITQLLVSFMGSVLYIIVIAWSLYYLYRSFESVLPWTTCDNWWNTHLCVNRLGNVSISETYVNNCTRDLLLEHSAWRKSNVWLEALLQGFYSMSVTYGGLITMSSYTKFHNNSLRDVVFLTVLGEASSIFCGLVVFSTLGFMAHHAQIPISDIVSSGSGLGFIIYPEAISHLPVSQLWAVLFFIMLITLGMDSLFGPMETVIAGTVEAYPSYLQPRRMYVTGGVCLFCFLMSVPYATNGGIYLLQLLDWYNSSFSILLIGCLECVVINWIYGWKRFGRDIQMMMGKQYPLVLKLLSTYVTPLILFASLVFSLFRYDPPSYGEYIYPEYAKAIGILMAVVMSLPIPISLLHQLIKRNGTFCERLLHASKPAYDWRPSRLENREAFLDNTDTHLDNTDTHLDNTDTHLDNTDTHLDYIDPGQADSSAV
ncbi:sodium- and chloride-dependent glycine transporter 1-like [Haliotis rubra]|uniref:sodium- and chloride-dependent glycine transporter 1-like n=1 Tax=Haliotis rubra TaxID=36100 RepID=UPI001EE52042|nr:sodium- and chloride-dependent glycine transporter 1-like [Haliotis rubra]